MKTLSLFSLAAIVAMVGVETLAMNYDDPFVGTQNLRALGGSRCLKHNKLPAEFEKTIEEFDTPTVPVTAKGVECTADHTTVVSSWDTLHPTGACGSKFHFTEQLEACCGGFTPDNSRTITISGGFKSPREINGVTFDITLGEEVQNCCQACKCWGDPHCSSFELDVETSGTRGIKSFLACDTARVKNDGKCTNRLDVDPGARERCLGLVDGYEHNGNGLCVWRPDTEPETFSVLTMGGPCVPAPGRDVAMKVLSSKYNEGMEQLGFGSDSDGDGVEDGELILQESEDNMLRDSIDVSFKVGERGVTEVVIITLKLKKPNGNIVTKVIEFQVKQDCAYPTNESGDLLIPNEGQSANEAVFDHPFFNIYRTMALQKGPGGTNTAIDIRFVLTDKLYGDQYYFNCRGATDRKQRKNALNPTFRELIAGESGTLGVQATNDLIALYTEQSDGFTQSAAGGEDSDSTRLPKSSHFDSVIWRSKIDKGQGNQQGFCFSGEFDEYKAEEWYNEESSPVCGVRHNLDYSDRAALAAWPVCKQVIKANDCKFEDYKTAQQNKSLKKHFFHYMNILEKCIILYCDAAFIPSQETPYSCMTEFYDYGSSVAMEKFVLKSAIDAADQEGESATVIPLVQTACTPFVKVTYKTEEGYEGTQVWDPANPQPIKFEVTGKPLQVLMEHNDCAGVCGTRPSLEFDASFSTVCEELDKDEYICVKKKGENDECAQCMEECADDCQA